jgi:hypothetical protein
MVVPISVERVDISELLSDDAIEAIMAKKRDNRKK